MVRSQNISAIGDFVREDFKTCQWTIILYPGSVIFLCAGRRRHNAPSVGSVAESTSTHNLRIQGMVILGQTTVGIALGGRKFGELKK